MKKLLKLFFISTYFSLLAFAVFINVFASYTRYQTAVVVDTQNAEYAEEVFELDNKSKMQEILTNSGLAFPNQKSDVLKVLITPVDKFLKGDES